MFWGVLLRARILVRPMINAYVVHKNTMLLLWFDLISTFYPIDVAFL